MWRETQISHTNPTHQTNLFMYHDFPPHSTKHHIGPWRLIRHQDTAEQFIPVQGTLESCLSNISLTIKKFYLPNLNQYLNYTLFAEHHTSPELIHTESCHVQILHNKHWHLNWISVVCFFKSNSLIWPLFVKQKCPISAFPPYDSKWCWYADKCLEKFVYPFMLVIFKSKNMVNL